jgi:hypothetical protein
VGAPVDDACATRRGCAIAEDRRTLLWRVVYLRILFDEPDNFTEGNSTDVAFSADLDYGGILIGSEFFKMANRFSVRNYISP